MANSRAIIDPRRGSGETSLPSLLLCTPGTLEEVTFGLLSRSEMETPSNVAPRRRRKRPRVPTQCDENKCPPFPAIKTASKSIPNLDDSELTFLDYDGDFVADRRVTASSVITLLKERSQGTFFGRQSTWQQRALQHHLKKPPPDRPRRQWRSYCKRSIPFTQLGTPRSEAVLAMDRKGSFVLCLGSKDLRGVPLALAIRFFGKTDACSLFLV